MTGKFELFTGSDAAHRFRLTAPDGTVMALSKPFPDKPSAVAGIAAVREYAGMGLVTEISVAEDDAVVAQPVSALVFPGPVYGIELLMGVGPVMAHPEPVSGCHAFVFLPQPISWADGPLPATSSRSCAGSKPREQELPRPD